MKYSIASVALLAASAVALPVVKKADIDLIVLQFALSVRAALTPIFQFPSATYNFASLSTSRTFSTRRLSQ